MSGTKHVVRKVRLIPFHTPTHLPSMVIWMSTMFSTGSSNGAGKAVYLRSIAGSVAWRSKAVAFCVQKVESEL